jgi:hypothetical protein
MGAALTLPVSRRYSGRLEWLVRALVEKREGLGMLNLEDLMTRGNYASTTSATGQTLTASGMLKQMERLRRMLDLADAGRIAPNGPLQVCESLLAMQTVPAKRHKKRRSQTEAYHRRVQKKWTKRHGTKQVPAAYMLDDSVLGGYGQTLVAHPSIGARLKRPNVVLSGARDEHAGS